MRRINKMVKSFLIATAIIYITLRPDPATTGALEGIYLCVKTLIPSLFPFMVLTSALLQNVQSIRIPPAAYIGKICHIPAGLENIFIVSLLGGYPLGAKLISQAYHNNLITRPTAQRMLGFCNNAGPAFIFGVIGHMFSSPWVPLTIWLIHIVSAIATGYLLPKINDTPALSIPNINTSATSLVEHCVQTMGIICGWVILFRIIISYITLDSLSPTATVVISGILELSNGCVQLSDITEPALRFVVSSLLISYGGICVLMQTSSVANGIGLKYYFPGKLLQTFISAILSLLIQPILFPTNFH